MSLAKKEKIQSDVHLDQLAEYFYKITNHSELYRIGRGLLAEREKGVKNFAFTSTGYKNSQQKSVLGLCCFFDQNTNYKIAIVSDHLLLGIFNDLVEAAVPNTYPLGTNGDVLNYRSFYHHFDFIDYKEFQRFYESGMYTKQFDSEVAKILGKYDIILWDIPEMDSMKKNSLFHSRMSQFYESMTVIVAQNATSGKQIDFIKKFFGSYNINLNGVLFDTNDSPEKPKRKKILGIFG
jgi:hypothetical protein